MPEKKTTTNQAAETEKDTESMKDLYAESGKPKAAGKGTKAKQPAGRAFSESYRVLVRPLITEKAAHESVNGKYTFEVAPEANKIAVARSIEDVYGIKPVAVRIVTLPGKRVRRGRIAGTRKGIKKAIVTLPKGQAIQIYEGV